MPLNSVNCPNCNVLLKPKTPIPEGTRLKCPKCATVFVAQGGGEDIPPTVAAPKAAGPRPAAPKPPAGVAPRPAAPRPAAVTPKPPAAAADDDIPEVTEVIDDDDATEGGAAPAKPKSKIPMWVWFAVGGGALVLVCCGCGGPLTYGLMYGVPGFGGGNVNKDHLDKIKKDMTPAQVETVMGGPPTLPLTESNGMKSETWKSGDDFITIGFMKDKAISSAYQLSLGGGAKLTGGGQLPP